MLPAEVLGQAVNGEAHVEHVNLVGKDVVGELPGKVHNTVVG